MDMEKLLKERSALIDAAEAIAAKDMDESAQSTFDEHMAAVDALDEQIKRAQKLQSARAEQEKSAGTKAASLTWQAAEEGEGEFEYDGAGWRTVEVRSPFGGTNTVRYNVPVAVAKSEKHEKKYAAAFEAYLHHGEAKMDRNYPEDYKTLSEGIDSAGGFLVPADYHEEIIKKTATMATVRQFALVAQTGRDIAQWPKVSYTDDDNYTSGVRLTWSGSENPASTSHRVTDPVFGLYNIPVNTAMASLPISRNLLEDAAFDVVGLSSQLLGEAFALGENDAFWNGSGAGRPRGLVTSAATSTNDPEHIESIRSATVSVFTPDELLQVWESLPSQYEANARWFFQKSTEGYIRRLTDTDGNFLWPVWPQVGNLGEHPREIQGFPISRDEFVPALSATTNGYSVFFGDMSGYLVLDRVGLSIERVREPYVEQNFMVLLGRKRVGGQVVQPWRIKAMNTSST